MGWIDFQFASRIQIVHGMQHVSFRPNPAELYTVGNTVPHFLTLYRSCGDIEQTLAFSLPARNTTEYIVKDWKLQRVLDARKVDRREK